MTNNWIAKAKYLANKFFQDTNLTLTNIELTNDGKNVVDRNCDNFIGFMKVPLGITKEMIKINNREYHIPVATTEGALIASMCRGIKLANRCGGIQSYVEDLGITRGIAITFKTFKEAMDVYIRLKQDQKYVDELKDIGNATSNYIKILSIESKHILGRVLYVKIQALTGDAMGMNMITKAANAIGLRIAGTGKLVTVSANTCTDKKWSHENYCNGRGKRVISYLEIDEKTCQEILHVSLKELYMLYKTKIVGGSSLVMANFNCQAANYVAGICLALGQDLGHIIESSNCVLYMELGETLEVSMYMPSIICGVVGGGTHLEPQSTFLKQYSVDPEFVIGDYRPSVGLAMVIAGAVMCGEISCMAALATNTLLEAHLSLNRSK